MSGSHFEDPTSEPRIFICPSQKGPWGVVTCTGGPRDPESGRIPDVRRAEALLRAGMVALDKHRPRRLDRAEMLFRAALDLLVAVLAEPHPRISYALDRLGLIYQLRGRLEEAEPLYTRALAALGERERPSRWMDVTLLNLATLYGCKGREAERDAVMRRFHAEA